MKTMRRGTKILLIVAASLMAAGILISAAAALSGGRFNKTAAEDVTHRANGAFESIRIVTSSSDVSVKISESGECYAVCSENDKLTYSLVTEGGTLMLTENDSRKWYDHIGFFFGTMKVTLYVPQGAYTELSVRNGSGNIVCSEQDISFESVSLSAASGNIFFRTPADELSVRSSSGEISVRGSTCSKIELLNVSGSIEAESADVREMSVRTQSGNIQLREITVMSVLSAESSSGNIDMERCDADTLELKSSSGNIRGTLLSDKIFNLKTNSGKIEAPESVRDAGICNASTSSGNIRFEIAD